MSDNSKSSLTHSLTHPLPRSLTHSLAHSLTSRKHSLTHNFANRKLVCTRKKACWLQHWVVVELLLFNPHPETMVNESARAGRPTQQMHDTEGLFRGSAEFSVEGTLVAAQVRNGVTVTKRTRPSSTRLCVAFVSIFFFVYLYWIYLVRLGKLNFESCLRLSCVEPWLIELFTQSCARHIPPRSPLVRSGRLFFFSASTLTLLRDFVSSFCNRGMCVCVVWSDLGSNCRRTVVLGSYPVKDLVEKKDYPTHG